MCIPFGRIIRWVFGRMFFRTFDRFIRRMYWDFYYFFKTGQYVSIDHMNNSISDKIVRIHNFGPILERVLESELVFYEACPILEASLSVSPAASTAVR